jgi:hypothetical protein
MGASSIGVAYSYIPKLRANLPNGINLLPPLVVVPLALYGGSSKFHFFGSTIPPEGGEEVSAVMKRHHKRRRLAAMAACVATIAALATLGSAGSASALGCTAPGFGSGDSTQTIAMAEVWLTSSGWFTHSSCFGPPEFSWVTYDHTSAGQALEEFGNNTGELNAHEDRVAFEAIAIKDAAGQVLDWFVGTDDPPTTQQLEKAQTAVGASSLAEMTFPVAQTSIAVLLSLPTGCKIQSTSKVDINSTTLGQLWEGTNAHSGEDPGGVQAQGGYAIGTWGAFFHQLGYTKITSGTPEAGQFLDEGGEHGCGQAIKPQVDSNVSGTAYAFKGFLNQINPHVWSSYVTDAKTWPTSAVVESDPLSIGGGSELNSTEGRMAGNTAANPGSVGFADTAYPKQTLHGGFTNEAKSSTFGTGNEGHSPAHQILWAEMQNNWISPEFPHRIYADPVVGSSVANCETSRILPAEEGFPYTSTGSWHGVLASDPNIAEDVSESDYPICQLTYALVWKHYSASKLYGKTEAAHEIANTVKDLFEYVTGQGQGDIQGHEYTRYPTGFQSHVSLTVSEIKY